MAGRVIGLGQEWAGDDGVGVAVVRHLRETEAPIEAAEVADPSHLIDLLTDGADPVVLVDAVLDQGPAGRVLIIDESEALSGRLLSTHGLGPVHAIELARITQPARTARRISIVGITIGQAQRRRELSEPVAAAVAPAAHQALRLAQI